MSVIPAPSSQVEIADAAHSHTDCLDRVLWPVRDLQLPTDWYGVLRNNRLLRPYSIKALLRTRNLLPTGETKAGFHAIAMSETKLHISIAHSFFIEACSMVPFSNPFGVVKDC